MTTVRYNFFGGKCIYANRPDKDQEKGVVSARIITKIYRVSKASLTKFPQEGFLDNGNIVILQRLSDVIVRQEISGLVEL